MTPEYLLLGHVTRDLLPAGAVAPGGTALYAALTAYRLGLRSAIVSARADMPANWPQAIALAITPSPTPPVFENRYTGGQRHQVIHAAASALTLADIPRLWRTAPIIHLGPVLREVPEEFVGAFAGALIGVTPQGWMRAWDTPLPASIRYVPWRPTPALLQQIDALVLSVEDVQGDTAIVRAYATHCPLVALTEGERGATLFIKGAPHHIPAHPAIERDPTGAGDVFAATLFCRLHSGDTPLRAANVAARVAAASVGTIGAHGLLALDLGV